ncbi:MAG: hypothetical protein IH851_04145, partial [Armatimonadetes bacterium]|nr:hypothetical protein [Armatimonadota bacterium]
MFSRLASRLRPLAPPALGGLLLALSFPPFGLFLVAFVALTPLLVCVRRLGFWGGFRKGYLFGLVFGLINLFWLEQFVSRWTGSVWMGALPWVLVSAAYAVYFGLFAGAAAHAWARGWPWAIPLIWAGVEVFRSTIPYLYFPWAILGTALYKAPVLLQPAWWGGAYLLSAWVALFSVLAALLWTGEPVRKTWAYGLALLAILAGSLVSFLGEREGESRVVVAVQPGVDLAFPPREEVNRLLAERMPEAMAIGSASHRDLVVLPEGVGRGWDEGAPVTAFELDTSVPLLLGAHRDA